MNIKTAEPADILVNMMRDKEEIIQGVIAHLMRESTEKMMKDQQEVGRK